jgi:tetratricopeptide (TPR) repeat protein/tRNA A-37 threonylcarbamoyl transferase component Bud32
LAEPVVPVAVDPHGTTGSLPGATASAQLAAAVGRYCLGEEIARGGMGAVYLATDTVLDREVAVKVLQDKYAPDSGVARRFAAEARITAQLQHPNIPAVHDLGTLPDGRPFLAMKLIKGQTLDHLLRQRTDPAVDRGRFVAVFEQVCQAVAYAHAHDVIHRDLKPQNVMVGRFGEVQVMDWGLAKVLGARPEEPADPEATTAPTAMVSLRESDEAHTHAGSVLGTPAYMPPEQAGGVVSMIDRRSDVFGLGAVLAVVLTGRPPFAADTAEAIRGRAALGDVGECFARLDRCGADPDLVALCKRCLAPKPEDRPAHAGEVAIAVAGLRAAAEERARRSAERRKRRRLALGAAAVLAAAAVGGLAAVLAVQRRANADLAAKNHELADEQAKVQARFDMAVKAIETFHTGVSEDLLLKNAEFKELRTKLLKEAAGFYADLEKLLAGQTDAKSRKALAAAYFQLGGLTFKIGDTKDALAVHRKALALRRELARAEGADAETRVDLARSLGAEAMLLYFTGDPKGALQAVEVREIATALEAEPATDAARSALAQTHTDIGYVLRQTGKPAEALESYQKALAIWQKLADANPAVARYQRDLAQIHTHIGLLVLMWMGKPEEALTAFRTASDIMQKMVDANPADIGFQYGLAIIHDHIGWCLLNMGKPVEGGEANRTASDIMQKLVDANRATTFFQVWLAIIENNLGRALDRQKRPAEAFTALDKGLVIVQKLAKADPNDTFNRRQLGESHAFRGGARARAGQPAEAAADLRRALELWAKLPSLDIEIQVERSRALALLAGLGGDAKSGVTKEEAKTFADQSVAALANALKTGWALPSELKEPDFDAVRGRADFQKLVAEVEGKAAATDRPRDNPQPGSGKK